MKRNSSHKGHGHLLARAGIAAWALGLVGALALVTFYGRLILPTDQMAAVITSTLVELANKDRQEESLGTLTVNPVLVAAAQAKANDMAEKGYFAHNSPDGKTSWYWFKEAGYSFSYAGENLAVNFTDSVEVERAWMNSPTHRANILNGNFTEIGIATAVGEYQGEKTVFVVQMFGTPARGAQATVNEVIPEDPEEIAVASTESASVLGSEAEPTAASAQPAAEEPAPIVEETVKPTVVSEVVPAPETLVTSPKTLLRTLYLLAAAALLVIFGLITRLELKRHHTRHVFAVCFLFVVMAGLFVIADSFLFPAPVIGQEIGN